MADAKTGMVNLKTLEVVGNAYNGVTSESQSGYKRLRDWLSLDSTKEFIDVCEEKSSKRDLSLGENKVLIRTGRGKNAKSMASIHIAIDFAMWLNPRFKYEVIDTFINKKILDARLLGIDSIKKLTDAMKEKFQDINQADYVSVNMAINRKVNGEFVKGWDVATATADKQQQRARIIDTCVTLINLGVANTVEKLIIFIHQM